MEYLENVKNLYNIVDDTAKDVAIIYSKTKLSREEVMDNGFDEVINALREEGKKEGLEEGKKEGIKEGVEAGEINTYLNCILAYQEHNGCTFDEAADILNVPNEMRMKIKNIALVTD